MANNILIIGLAVSTISTGGLLIGYLYSRRKVQELEERYKEFERFRKNFGRQLMCNDKVSNLTYSEREGGIRTYGDLAKLIKSGTADSIGALCHLLPLMALEYEYRLEAVADRKAKLEKSNNSQEPGAETPPPPKI